MHTPFFFGYGSLVNRATHDYVNAHPAELTGWRRVWRHTELRPEAFLTAVPAPGHRIDGLVAGVPGNDWDALDLREHAYDRVPTSDVAHPLPHEIAVQVYTIPEGKHSAPTHAHPVLLSYLDVVVQGFLREFGEDGVARFFETTDGWDAPILNERDSPRYPRHQSLSAGERRLVDGWLEEIGAKVVVSA